MMQPATCCHCKKKEIVIAIQRKDKFVFQLCRRCLGEILGIYVHECTDELFDMVMKYIESGPKHD